MNDHRGRFLAQIAAFSLWIKPAVGRNRGEICPSFLSFRQNKHGCVHVLHMRNTSRDKSQHSPLASHGIRTPPSWVEACCLTTSYSHYGCCCSLYSLTWSLRSTVIGWSLQSGARFSYKQRQEEAQKLTFLLDHLNNNMMPKNTAYPSFNISFELRVKGKQEYKISTKTKTSLHWNEIQQPKPPVTLFISNVETQNSVLCCVVFNPLWLKADDTIKYNFFFQCLCGLVIFFLKPKVVELCNYSVFKWF